MTEIKTPAGSTMITVETGEFTPIAIRDTKMTCPNACDKGILENEQDVLTACPVCGGKGYTERLMVYVQNGSRVISGWEHRTVVAPLG